MADIVSREKRSQIMAKIRSRNTEPELLIRKGLHARGFRYKLYDRSLPGKPDLVFPRYKSAIFVNGCFWHSHSCHLYRLPKSNIDYWRKKLSKNIERDNRNIMSLKNEGWRILIIWECAILGKTRNPIDLVIEKASDWLLSDSTYFEMPGNLYDNS